MGKFKKSDKVKIKIGCVLMHAIIDSDSDDEWYEVSYDKKEYAEMEQYRYFADVHVSNIVQS